jgi:hypothetical protein
MKRHIPWYLFGALALAIFGYVLIHDLAGGSLFSHSVYDSYSLQAGAWLDGRDYLIDGQNYTWLELAVYHGRYYVSFPPLPTLPMVPMVLIFGQDTPSNMVVVVYALAALVGAYMACRAMRLSDRAAAIWAVFAVLASNMLQISTNGGVWLQAQTLNMALLMWGAYFTIKQKRTASIVMFALAVGCRPFSICYLPVALIYFLWTDKDLRVKNYIAPVLSALLIGVAYGWYNYIRFGNPIEFGHNYLPEFTRAEYGQFNLRYLSANLRNIFLRPIKLLPSGGLDLPMFDGFMFYVANPFFIALIVRIIKDIRSRVMPLPAAALCVGLIINLLLLCTHKTFGGWQFGARYTIDLIPYAFIYILISGRTKLSRLDEFLCGFGLLFNSYGAMKMFTI